MKEDKYAKSLAKSQVYAIVHMRDIRKNVSPKFLKLCMETPCLCPFQGHKYGRRKPTETSVFEFSDLCLNSYTRNVFDPHKSFPGRQLNDASRKSLEFQASCIAKQRTLLNQKFVCMKVLRCSNITRKQKLRRSCSFLV